MKDHEHPFFRPLWRRIAIIAVCVAWSAFEFYNDATTWGMIAGAFAAYAVWQFLYLYKEPVEQPAGEAAQTPSETPKE